MLKVADGGTYSHRLPQDAVLRLHLTDGTTTATQGRQLTAWRQGKTDASGTPGTSGYVPATTTFRALVALEDVPGITATATVRPGSVLGEVTYTDGGSRQTQRITYSVKSAPAGSTDADGNALIAAGTRITVTATFKDIPEPPTPPTPPTPSNVTIQGSATLAPWQDTDLGEVGTEEVTDMELVTEGEKTIYQIYTAEGLKEFADMVNGTEAYATARSNGKTKDPAANARLMADIDLSSVCGASVGGEPGTSWAPMGSNGNDNYTGTFDGQGHTVRGLYISSASYQDAGLFGAIGTNGKVEHLRVEATEVKNTSSSAATGVLAGYNSGTITDCHATGNVSGSGNYIGGLVGDNSRGTITDCHATGNVSGSGSYIGGLVGNNISSTITACYATGSVSGSGNSSNIGGLVGDNFNSSTITACYATGSVSSSGNNSSIGGLVGFNSSSPITDCFWQKGADSTPAKGIGGGTTSGTITLTEITGTEPNTWENAVGTYTSPGEPSSTSTLNAAICTWNRNDGADPAKHCGYCFVKNPAYQSAATTPGVAPLLLTPIEE